ncbi:crossover junction endodeoxyribonuclease RuvC [Paenibacillus sp. ACRRX]|uniref:crossover junction endodeoxyribonuclease RuvC n=1 Tax=Paenibacillus sp. ACRRX TaxID=2918206 RepID=UPI001EF6B136|nr:crossover junction endodeoxyribonuclease RuvC [Paenibacillus sp. ACRRX]MCG7407724.1 crossover junction endodeoxyribonuclease RuvC [Paenibacillus sp. ACRRX]
MITYHLGLDTSLTKSGWAIISVAHRKASLVDYGLIKSTAKLSDGERLRQIHMGITGIIAKYPQIERVIPREEGIVRFNVATRQVFKSHGVSEFALADYNIADINIQTVKAWARRVTGSPGSRKDKDMIAEAVRIYFGDPTLQLNKGGDEADAIAVVLVHLQREGLIAA